MATSSEKPLRTWSHLTGERRKPSEYEVVSVRLHYHTKNPEAPWELSPELPVSRWYRRYRSESPLRHPDWDEFRDPDALVYRGYNRLQDEAETYIDGVLDELDGERHDATLPRGWVDDLRRLHTPSRYLAHAVQMASAYLSQMAPASTITNCATFQAADSLRWLSHVAYRTRQLADAWPGLGFGTDERIAWESDPAWQGFRRLLEELLVAYDWGETFVALNLVAKPAIAAAIHEPLARAASHRGDRLTPILAQTALRDDARSRRWSVALVRMVGEAHGNGPVLERWIAKWVPLAEDAVDRFVAAIPVDGAVARARQALHESVRELGFAGAEARSSAR
jgi:toluene monooxygenase system protein E